MRSTSRGSSIDVRGSTLCGDYRAIGVFTNGLPDIEHSLVRVSANNSAFLVETENGRVNFAASRLGFIPERLATGAGTAPKCVVSYDFGTFNQLTTACANE